MSTPYRESGAHEDLDAFAPPATRKAEQRAVVVAGMMIMLVGLLFALRADAPYFLLGLLPPALYAMIDSLVRLSWLWRLARARATPAKSAQPGRIAIRGRVVAGDTTPFVAPVSGQLAVWARVQAHAESNDPELRRTVSDLVAMRDFCIDDGSGELAHVELSGARVMSRSLAVTIVQALTPRLERYFQRHPPKRHDPICAVDELALRLEDEVVVVARARRATADEPHPGRLILDGAGALVSRVPPPSPATSLAVLLVSLVIAVIAIAPFILAHAR
jgi:hypothetical protein